MQRLVSESVLNERLSPGYMLPERLGIFNLTFSNRQSGSWGFSEKFFCFLFPLFKAWIKYLTDL